MRKTKDSGSPTQSSLTSEGQGFEAETYNDTKSDYIQATCCASFSHCCNCGEGLVKDLAERVQANPASFYPAVKSSKGQPYKIENIIIPLYK